MMVAVAQLGGWAVALSLALGPCPAVSPNARPAPRDRVLSCQMVAAHIADGGRLRLLQLRGSLLRKVRHSTRNEDAGKPHHDQAECKHEQSVVGRHDAENDDVLERRRRQHDASSEDGDTHCHARKIDGKEDTVDRKELGEPGRESERREFDRLVEQRQEWQGEHGDEEAAKTKVGAEELITAATLLVEDAERAVAAGGNDQRGEARTEPHASAWPSRAHRIG
mmetsp:Transcript_50156/g.147973  ORF Transcript_50156/g.147973 Transcript_50156/m.147973 type:complete len:223 (-) Transcript_50156:11-679(-)